MYIAVNLFYFRFCCLGCLMCKIKITKAYKVYKPSHIYFMIASVPSRIVSGGG